MSKLLLVMAMMMQQPAFVPTQNRVVQRGGVFDVYFEGSVAGTSFEISGELYNTEMPEHVSRRKLVGINPLAGSIKLEKLSGSSDEVYLGGQKMGENCEVKFRLERKTPKCLLLSVVHNHGDSGTLNPFCGEISLIADVQRTFRAALIPQYLPTGEFKLTRPRDEMVDLEHMFTRKRKTQFIEENPADKEPFSIVFNDTDRFYSVGSWPVRPSKKYYVKFRYVINMNSENELKIRINNHDQLARIPYPESVLAEFSMKRRDADRRWIPFQTVIMTDPRATNMSVSIFMTEGWGQAWIDDLEIGAVNAPRNTP
jgi:hypothetical protein